MSRSIIAQLQQEKQIILPVGTRLPPGMGWGPFFFPELEIIHYCILKRKLNAVHFSFASAKTDELVFQLHREIHRTNQKARVQLLYN